MQVNDVLKSISSEKYLSTENFSNLLSEFLNENYIGKKYSELTLAKIKKDLNEICDYIIEKKLDDEYLEIIYKTFIK